MGPFPISFGFVYILLTVDYVSKRVEAKPTRTNDAMVVVDFVRSNLFAGLESLEPSLVIKAPIFVTGPCMPCLKSMVSCTERYAKFLKELCTHKRKFTGNERINMRRNVSALIGKFVPHIHEKCKDPCTFYIPCIIGNSKLENAMLDLGASVSVMPLSIFNSLSLGPL